MLQLLVWQKRQMPPQQTTIGPAPIERIKRTNAVVVRGLGQSMGAPLRRNPYAIEVNCGRNCYACGGFGHMAHHCRNRGKERAIEKRRVKYRKGRFEGNIKQIEHLKEVENLEALD